MMVGKIKINRGQRVTRRVFGWPKTGKEEEERMGLMKDEIGLFSLLFLLIWAADRGRGLREIPQGRANGSGYRLALALAAGNGLGTVLRLRRVTLGGFGCRGDSGAPRY